MGLEREHCILKDLVRNLRMRPAVYLPPEAQLREAIAVMQNEGVTSVLIGRETDIQGILTEERLVNSGLPAGMDLYQPVSSLMYSPVVTVRADQTVDHVLRTMIETNLRHLPVTDGDKVIGVVRTQGMVKYIAEYFPAAILNLPPDPSIPSECFGG